MWLGGDTTVALLVVNATRPTESTTPTAASITKGSVEPKLMKGRGTLVRGEAESAPSTLTAGCSVPAGQTSVMSQMFQRHFSAC